MTTYIPTCFASLVWADDPCTETHGRRDTETESVREREALRTGTRDGLERWARQLKADWREAANHPMGIQTGLSAQSLRARGAHSTLAVREFLAFLPFCFARLRLGPPLPPFALRDTHGSGKRASRPQRRCPTSKRTVCRDGPRVSRTHSSAADSSPSSPFAKHGFLSSRPSPPLLTLRGEAGRQVPAGRERRDRGESDGTVEACLASEKGPASRPMQHILLHTACSPVCACDDPAHVTRLTLNWTSASYAAVCLRLGVGSVSCRPTTEGPLRRSPVSFLFSALCFLSSTCRTARPLSSLPPRASRIPPRSGRGRRQAWACPGASSPSFPAASPELVTGRQPDIPRPVPQPAR